MAGSGATLGSTCNGYKDGDEFGGFSVQRSKAFGWKNTCIGQKLQPVSRLFQFL